MQDVYRRVYVSVQYQPTIWTGMDTVCKRFLDQFTAVRTHLRGIARVNQNDGSASFYRGAPSQADKLRPRYIHDALSHTTAFAHFL